MSSTYGKNIKISIFGQSHSSGIGVVIDGLPAGKKVDMKKLATFMEDVPQGKVSILQVVERPMNQKFWPD